MDFSVSGNNYRTGKMDAFTQFHVCRRLAPLFSALKDAYSAGRTDFNTGFDAGAKALSGMSDGDSEYILKACLDVTQRQVGTAWTPIRVQNRMQYQDIDLPAMMQIVWRVLEENLAPFFSVNPSTFTSAAPA